ncbi:RNA-dependent DNA polymerase [Phytophthora cinnamomi]|uniref:RNA-dependent DNA polymerase n=1 Tax=Phytophthora cinnamomi TaxID=4785 RepID=UPI00355ABEF2|nr:RNA-dependent DNA polymerase [Phytophthora cinnamomi]
METPAMEQDNDQPETKVVNAESSQYGGGVTGETHEKEVTAAVTKQLDAWVIAQGDSGVAGSSATPSVVQAALEEEMQAKDVERRRVLLAKASTLQNEAVQTHEADQQRRRRQKRVERTKARRERRADREHAVVSAGGSGAANGKRSPTEASKENAVSEDTGNVNTAEMITDGHNDALGEEQYRHAAEWRAYMTDGDEGPGEGETRAARVASGSRVPSEAYFVFDEMWRVDQGQGVKKISGGDYPVRVGRLRAVHAPAVDALPTAIVKARTGWKRIKFETVDYVEGLTGAIARGLGVRRFKFLTQYGQEMEVDALVVEGAADEFLLGEDWMLPNGVKIDFTSCEMKWYDGDDKKIVPFSCQKHGRLDEHTVRVRLVKGAKVTTSTCRRVELAVVAPEGTTGLFMPAQRAEPHLMLAPTLTTVHDSKVVVPVMSLVVSTTKLPVREALGTLTPTSEDMEVLKVGGMLTRSAVRRWLNGPGRSEKLPSNEQDLDIGGMAEEDKQLLLTLLRRYPTLLEPREGCPPMTTLGVEHEIHTGTEAPVMVRPRRHAHEEQRVIDGEVDSMLKTG